MTDQTLNGPSRCIAQRTDGVAFNLLGHFKQGVDFGHISLAFAQPLHHTPHPARAFAAWGALAAAFMLIEIAEPRNGADDIGRFVHDNDCRRAKARAERLQAIKIHWRVHDFLGRNQRYRRATRNNGKEIVPTAANAACMLFNQLTEGNAHRFFHGARLVHMARNLEQLGSSIILTAKALEPIRATAQDRWRDGNGFHIVDRGWATIKARARRERRLQARLALFAFQAFDHRGFFTADIGPCPTVHEHVKIIAGLGGIFAEQAGGIGFVHGGLKHLGFVDKLTANIDIGGACAHGETRNQCTFQQAMRIMANNLTILARPRL